WICWSIHEAKLISGGLRSVIPIGSVFTVPSFPPGPTSRPFTDGLRAGQPRHHRSRRTVHPDGLAGASANITACPGRLEKSRKASPAGIMRRSWTLGTPTPLGCTTTGWAARTTLVKWFRDGRTVAVQLSYRHVTTVIRILGRSPCGSCIVPVWVLCPIFLTGVPDSGLTPLAGGACLAWSFPVLCLAFGRAGLSCRGAVARLAGVLLAMPCPRVAGVVVRVRACGGPRHGRAVLPVTVVHPVGVRAGSGLSSGLGLTGRGRAARLVLADRGGEGRI